MASATQTSRDALLAAAFELLTSGGFDALTMDQVRSRAGVSNGSLYHHFPTKAHLARAVYGAVIVDYQQHLLKALRPSVAARTGVEALVRRHIAWVLHQPAKARLLIDLREFTAVAEEPPVWQEANAQAHAALQGWIATHVRAGALQDLPYDVWFAVVIAPVLHLSERWVREPRPQVPARVRQALIHAAWKAVAPDEEHR